MSKIKEPLFRKHLKETKHFEHGYFLQFPKINYVNPCFQRDKHIRTFTSVSFWFQIMLQDYMVLGGKSYTAITKFTWVINMQVKIGAYMHLFKYTILDYWYIQIYSKMGKCIFYPGVCVHLLLEHIWTTMMIQIQLMIKDLS